MIRVTRVIRVIRVCSVLLRALLHRVLAPVALFCCALYSALCSVSWCSRSGYSILLRALLNAVLVLVLCLLLRTLIHGVLALVSEFCTVLRLTVILHWLMFSLWLIYSASLFQSVLNDSSGCSLFLGTLEDLFCL